MTLNQMIKVFRIKILIMKQQQMQKFQQIKHASIVGTMNPHNDLIKLYIGYTLHHYINH